MNKIFKMNLTLFGETEKDFFTNAFEEAYNITEGTPEGSDGSEEGSKAEVDNNIDNKDEKPDNGDNQIKDENKELSADEIKELYEKHFGSSEKEPEYDEDTQSAIELYKFLEQNPHLIQAMRDYDVEGYQTLNNYVPDEITKKLNELESFKAEYEYKEYVNGLKGKYSDFDEDKVLEYAESVNILDLEVAYKAMKADSIKEPNVAELREQIKKELLEELKQNSINTQSLVGGTTQKPIMNENVNLSSKEEKIARAMGISPSEYAKWR